MESLATFWHYPQKKIKRYIEQDPVKVAAYLDEIKDIDPATIIYIDEMGCRKAMLYCSPMQPRY